MKYEELGRGVVRRRENKKLALFIDGTGLDRATRRLNRRVDLSALVRSVSSGLSPSVARYYTLIPHEDDSRQRAFLDAVSRAGLSVVVKRLPPKGVNRQVSIDVEMTSDMIAYAAGMTLPVDQSYISDVSDKSEDTNNYQVQNSSRRSGIIPLINNPKAVSSQTSNKEVANLVDSKQEAIKLKASDTSALPNNSVAKPENRIITVVCPSRELSYPLLFLRSIGIDTTSADFGKFSGQDLFKNTARWIDLSDSETIWRDKD